jgi:hypothetical protein
VDPVIVIWRGWGLLAAAALVLPLAVCGTLADKAPGAAPILAGLALAAAGAGCWALGRRWNRGTVRHSLYFIPLQYWGLAHLALGVLFASAGAASLFRPGA